MKLDIKNVVSAVMSSADEHLPEILTGTGIGLMVAGVALAVVATVKAVKKLEQEDDVVYYENDESKVNDEEIPDSEMAIRYHYQETHPDVDVDSMDILEIIKAGKYKRKHKWKKILKLIWKDYIFVALSVVIGITCLICSTREGLRRTAALATAYQLTDTAFTEYRNKVVDTIGEQKERDIHTELAKDKAEKAAEKYLDNPEYGIIHTGDGETLIFDATCGRFFRSDIDFIKRQATRINHGMLKDGLDGFCSLNTFYEAINLPNANVGDKLGWRIDHDIIEIRDSSINHPQTGEPAYVLSFYAPPRYDFAYGSRYS